MFDRLSQNLLRVWLPGFCLVLSACGGNQTAGIDGTGGNPVQLSREPVTSVGTITALDGLEVNGVRYDISHADIILDEALGSEDDLSLGQIVIVEGMIDSDGETGIANSIRYNTSVLGPIDVIDAASSRLMILGQEIFVDEKTLFSGDVTTLVQLQPAQLIRISGFINSLGQVVASYIDVSVESDLHEVVGAITELNAANKTFKINDLLVDYSQAGLSLSLVNGDVVEVRGNLFTHLDRFVAQDVLAAHIQLGEPGRQVQLEGLVTEVLSSTVFTLNGITITVPDDIVYENGVAADLELNTRIEVEGVVADTDTVNGVLAEKIIFIHTLALSHGEDIGENQTHIFTLQSTDADKGLWINLSNHSDFPPSTVTLTVNLVDGDNLTEHCYSSNFCYVKNTAAATWQIILQSKLATSYELTAFFRRTELLDAVELTPGQAVLADAMAGEQSAYVLAAGAPGSILAVNLGDADQLFHFYVMADGQPTAARNTCRRSINAGAYATCYLKNDDAETWHIIVEGSADGVYRLEANHITPIELSSGVAHQAVLNRGAALYRIKAQATDMTVAASLTDMNGKVVMSINPTAPPAATVYRCGSTQQCVVGNNGVNDWYIMLAGDNNAAYTLTALTQSYQPDIVDFTPGDTMTVSQEAGVRAIYRLPAASEGSVMFASLVDASTNPAPFRLITAPDFDAVWFLPCQYYHPTIFNAHCFGRNDSSAAARYIVVENTYAGSYTLTVKDEQLTSLVSGVPVEGAITDTHGVLYQFDASDEVKTVGAIVSNASGPGRIKLMPNEPSVKDITCSSYSLADRMCVHRNTEATSWYLYVSGEIGMTFSVGAVGQTQQLDTVSLIPGQRVRFEQEAAVQAHYRLPPGPPGSVFTAVVSDMNTNFNLYVHSDPIVFARRSDFSSRYSGVKNDVVRFIQDASIDEKHLLVQSANAGAYSLWFDYIFPTPALAGEPIIEASIAGPQGDLYYFDFNEDVGTINIQLDELAEDVEVLVRAGDVPSAYDCILAFAQPAEKSCSTRNGASNNRWYVLINGVENTEYSFVVNVE
ncbi:MAG: hypothetical protein KTR20_14245 [Cellvibrionaceae bacterium]|nr:hypothetical protein [Cellvibrionaceae bacterium]